MTAVQLLAPRTLKANVLGTARIGEFRKGTKVKGQKEVQGGDPEWMSESKYFPALEGWAKHHLGNYFKLVAYMEEDFESKIVGGKVLHLPVYKTYMLNVGDFKVKNQWGHHWRKRGYPAVLENATWPQIDKMLDTWNRKEVRNADDGGDIPGDTPVPGAGPDDDPADPGHAG